MHLRRASFGLLFCLGLALAQSSRKEVRANTLFFLKDDASRQWCAYADESAWKGQVQLRKADIFGGVDYDTDLASTIRITEVDFTGDWAVHDRYSLDRNGQIQALKRVVNYLPEDKSDELSFIMKNGKEVSRSRVGRNLRTGQVAPDQFPVVEIDVPPVIMRVEAFGFASLMARRREVLSKGMLCVTTKE